jgi:hypothetical protein
MVGAWALLLASLGSMFALHRSALLNRVKWLFLLQAALAFSAGVALAHVFLGRWLVTVFHTVAGWIAGITGIEATVLLSVVLFVAAATAVVGLLDRRADKLEKIGMLIVPSLASATAVGIAAPILTASSAWYGFAAGGIAHLLT